MKYLAILALLLLVICLFPKMSPRGKINNYGREDSQE